MNRLKTTLLLGGLTALMLAVGYYFGGQQGALVALILSAIMNLGSYWFFDKIALALYLELLNKNELRGMFAGNSRNERGGGNAFGT